MAGELDTVSAGPWPLSWAMRSLSEGAAMAAPSAENQRLPGAPLVPPGFVPEPASFAPVLFMVPERLIPPVEGPLPDAPGEEPEPASFGPVLFAVPERLAPPELPSAANAGLPRARMAAMASTAFMDVSPFVSAGSGVRAAVRLRGNRASVKLFLELAGSDVQESSQPYCDGAELWCGSAPNWHTSITYVPAAAFVRLPAALR